MARKAIILPQLRAWMPQAGVPAWHITTSVLVFRQLTEESCKMSSMWECLDSSGKISHVPGFQLSECKDLTCQVK